MEKAMKSTKIILLLAALFYLGVAVLALYGF